MPKFRPAPLQDLTHWSVDLSRYKRVGCILQRAPCPHRPRVALSHRPRVALVSAGPSALQPCRLNLIRQLVVGGFCYQYFYEGTSTQDIMLVSHSLCLAHISDPGREGSSALRQLYFGQLIQTFKNADADTYGSYLPVREQIGMFLEVRATCSFALTFCTSWYHENVRRRTLAVSCVRGAVSRRIGARLVLGCVCSGCELVWLRRGWQCPATRSIGEGTWGARTVIRLALAHF